ncbi:dihydropteroate synthase [Enterobacter hormaechei]|uniref:dihydropteroate synthase n=1 Tax=Enterobacter hormaechei TaxID=158836 RepID=UPI0038FCC714
MRQARVAADRLILDPGMGFFLSPAPETSLHVLSNLQKLKSALGLPLLVSVSRKSFLGATVGLPVKDLGPASLAAELHAIGNGADYVRTTRTEICRSAITFSETLAKFRSRDARDRGLDHAWHSPSGRPLNISFWVVNKTSNKLTVREKESFV